jgi:DNA-binding response OmpR family regulator
MAKIENNTSDTKNNDGGNKKARVMVVDDEPDVISVLEIVLEDNGFEVDSFTDPIAALKDYKVGLYDLLILDIKMQKWMALNFMMKSKRQIIKPKFAFLPPVKCII